MSGSYIDPCESGAYQGSGSVGSEGSGSWNGSGSGNDSITSENCCPQPVAGVACCIPGKLKMRLYRRTLKSYVDPDPLLDLNNFSQTVEWFEIEESKIYTLVKTVFCEKNNSSDERWVIQDPDSTFGDWGDLAGMYFTTAGYLWGTTREYNIILPNSPVVSIKGLRVQCKCVGLFVYERYGSVAVNGFPSAKCANCFLAQSAQASSYGTYAASRWGGIPNPYPDYGLGVSESIMNMSIMHDVMIWGENTDLEKCYDISESPPKFLHTSEQKTKTMCKTTLGYKTSGYTDLPSVTVWKRLDHKYSRALPPFYCYVPCEFPFIKGAAGTDDRIGGGWTAFPSYNPLYYMRSLQRTIRLNRNFFDGYAAEVGIGYSCQDTLTKKNGYVVASSWFGMTYNRPTEGLNDSSSNMSVRAVNHFTTVNPMSRDCNTDFPCITKVKNVAPVYDILYQMYYYSLGWGGSAFQVRPEPCLPSGQSWENQSIPCEERMNYTSLLSPGRLILTEAEECSYTPPTPPASGVVPGYPAPIPPPGSGSTPTQSGSAPFSGSGSQPPCGGDCSYNFAWAYLGKDGVWYLNYKYSSSTCTEWCSCDVNVAGEIYVNYNGTEGGWPLVLNLPCVPAVVMGSTSEE